MRKDNQRIEGALAVLEEARRQRAPSRSVPRALGALASSKLTDLDSLVRFHDALLFLRAYPPDRSVMRLAESLLRGFPKRMAALGDRTDFDPLLDLDVSGIAGTAIETDGYGYDCIRWLAARFPRATSIDLDLIPAADRMAALLQDSLPLVEEESSADANLAIDAWMRAAGVIDGDGGLHWLLQQIDGLPIPPRLRSSLFESLGLFIRWNVGSSRASRTLSRWPVRSVHFHDGPLLGRRDVDLDREMTTAPLPVTKLSRKEGADLLDLAREAMATRYRELYGFTQGDPASVIVADAGRGLQIAVSGIVPDRRLPVRAGFGTLLIKNGVPVGYADAYGIGERLDISLNIFYAYRDGESAWCLARMLRLYRQLFRSTVFALDPYQIGSGNEEAIASGAFWFYRKLGFRSTNAAVEALARREEKRMAADREHRTAAGVLRRLAVSSIVYEVPGYRHGSWDGFHIRNLGLAVDRAMAKSRQAPERFRSDCCERVAASLGLRQRSLDPRQRQAFERMAPLLATFPLARWNDDDRNALVDVIRAKASRRESAYLRLTAAHKRLQQSLLRMGVDR